MAFSTTETHARRTMRNFVTDFAVALLLFSFIAGVFSISASNAFPAPPPAELVAPASAAVTKAAAAPVLLVAQPTFADQALGPDPAHTLVILALAFATLAAMNMAVYRHLRTAYASPRRRSWRRGQAS